MLSVVYPLLDPMNALTNLTGVGGGPNTIGMGPRPPGAPVGGMGAMGPMQISQHAMAGVTGNPQASECFLSVLCWLQAACKRLCFGSSCV